MNKPLQTLNQTAPRPTFISTQTGTLQRKCVCGQHNLITGGECEACRKKHEGILQRSAANATPVNDVPPIVHEVLRSPGQPLNPATRAFMEPRFGYDFSQVRVHTDAKAIESTKAVSALAYTVGRDIVFASGQYAPGTTLGQRLLAHELAHVGQQAGSSSADTRLNLEDSLAAEQEANHASETVFSGQMADFHPIHVNAGLQRKPAPVDNSIASMPLEETVLIKAIQNIPQMPLNQALLVLKGYQQFIIRKINIGEKRTQDQMSLRAESFTNYLIGGTIEFFGRTSLPSDNWEEPWRHVKAAYSTIEKGQVKESLDCLLTASEATKRHWERLNESFEQSDEGAKRSVVALKVVIAAAVAAELVLGAVLVAPAIPAIAMASMLETAAMMSTPAALEMAAATPAALEMAAATPAVLEAAAAAPAALETAGASSSALSATAKTLGVAAATTTLASDSPMPAPSSKPQQRRYPRAYPILWPAVFGPPMFFDTPITYFRRTPNAERDQDYAWEVRRELWARHRGSDPDLMPQDWHAHHIVPLFLGGLEGARGNVTFLPGRLHLSGHGQLASQPQMATPPPPLPPLHPNILNHPVGTLYELVGFK